MAQPKIVTNQLDVGTGADALLTENTLFVTGTGRTIQSVHGIITGQTGSGNNIPYDNTVPLVTEGTQFGSGPITTIRADTHIHFDFSITVDASANGTDIIVAVFRDTLCVGAGVVTIDTAGKPKVFSLTGYDNPGLGTYTYTGRIGAASGGASWFINSTNSGNNLGGALNTAFVLWECV